MAKKRNEDPYSSARKNKRDTKLRRIIALEAAKMMYQGSESEYYTAKRKAARQIGVGKQASRSDLPSNAEVRDSILRQASLLEGEKRLENLQQMRVYAYWLMEQLMDFSPKLIGSTLTGHIRKNSDIDLHVFSNSLTLLTQTLDQLLVPYEIEKKRVIKHNQERYFTHIHFHGRFEVELTVYTLDYVSYGFKCSITGKTMENASLKQLFQLLQNEYPEMDLAEEMVAWDDKLDSYDLFPAYLNPLEGLDGGKHHPEGDLLYHSLQVFELAREEGYAHDVEFLQAALLHDIGKSIDKKHHAIVGAEILEGLVSPRVIFLIRYHMDMLDLQRGQLGHRKTIRLRQSEYWDDLIALRDFDNRGRIRGMIVDSVGEVISYLKNLERVGYPC